MLANELNRSVLEHDLNNTSNCYRKVYVIANPKLPSGGYILKTNSNRVSVEASDAKGEDRALEMLHRLLRVKEGGVLQFPGMEIED